MKRYVGKGGGVLLLGAASSLLLNSNNDSTVSALSLQTHATRKAFHPHQHVRNDKDVAEYSQVISSGKTFSNSGLTVEDETSPYYMALDHSGETMNSAQAQEQREAEENEMVDEIGDMDQTMVGDVNLPQLDGQIISEAELLDNTWDTLIDMKSMTEGVLDKDQAKSKQKAKEEEQKKKDEKKQREQEDEQKAIQEARDEILKQESVDTTALQTGSKIEQGSKQKADSKKSVADEKMAEILKDNEEDDKAEQAEKKELA